MLFLISCYLTFRMKRRDRDSKTDRLGKFSPKVTPVIFSDLPLDYHRFTGDRYRQLFVCIM